MFVLLSNCWGPLSHGGAKVRWVHQEITVHHHHPLLNSITSKLSSALWHYISCLLYTWWSQVKTGLFVYSSLTGCVSKGFTGNSTTNSSQSSVGKVAKSKVLNVRFDDKCCWCNYLSSCSPVIKNKSAWKWVSCLLWRLIDIYVTVTVHSALNIKVGCIPL